MKTQQLSNIFAGREGTEATLSALLCVFVCVIVKTEA